VPTPHLKAKPSISWETLPADFILPDDLVESIEQLTLANALTDALEASKLIHPGTLIASNFGLAATVNNKHIVKAPNWFYVPAVTSNDRGSARRSYTPNLEGEPVSIVIEFLSEIDGGELSLRATPPYGKLYFYEQILQVPTYITYDPFEPSLEVRCLQDGKYACQVANDRGQFWIPELELFVGIWLGERLGQSLNWLRWWDKEGNLVLWSAERVEYERQQAEWERERAEQERQRAEQERQRAEQECQRADREFERAERLADRLRTFLGAETAEAE
jgi:Uma2 family endonuclease